jgi:hypothetical protein
MAYTTINKSGDYFNTKLYTGNGSTQSITGVGFQPDFLWIKERSSTSSHTAHDAVRGATKYLTPNTADVEGTGFVTSFNSDGFTLPVSNLSNQNNETYASWNWKAGTAVSGNTTGSGSYKSYTGSVNTTSGFSIIKYTGNGTSGHTIPHHLGAVPEWILVKDLDAEVNWQMYHVSLGNTYTTELNITNAPFQSSSRWNNTTPSSTVVTLGNGNNVNNNNTNYIMYAFTSKTGYSKFGSYIGNGNADGTFVYTGFKPAFILQKRVVTAANSNILDNKRAGYNVDNNRLFPNTTDVENTLDIVDIVSNGFKWRNTGSNYNNDGENNIYMAFAAAPLVGSNNTPATAR